MKSTRVLAFGAAAALLIVGLPATAQADEIVRTGHYTVAKGKTIDGDLTVRNGSLAIYGTVKGNVRQVGSGNVTLMPGATIEGNLMESGAGNLNVHGRLKGNASEDGAGHVLVARGALVEGNVQEKLDGSIDLAGLVKGNVREGGTANITVRATARIDGNVTETNNGNIVIYRGAVVEGDLREHDAGALYRR